MENKIILINLFNGNSKTNDKPYTCYKLAELFIDTEGDNHISEKTFFTNAPVHTDNLKFGDQVKATFKQSDFLGGKPTLTKLVKTGESPFYK